VEICRHGAAGQSGKSMLTDSPANLRETTVAASGSEDNRILIVDDEEPICALFEAQLGDRYGVTAANAQEALLRLAEQRFALVVTDVQMPGMSGINLMRKILEEFSDIR